MYVRLFLEGIIVFLLIACQPKVTLIDEKIEKNMRKEMNESTKQIIEGFSENNPNKILNISTNSCKQAISNNLNSIILKYGYYFNYEKYKIFNEFYQKGLMKGIQTTISTGSSSIHDYFLKIQPETSEIYVSIGYFDIDNEQTSLALVWSKVKNKWLLQYMHGGILKIGHKDAIEWLNDAKIDHNKENYCNAGIKLAIVSKLLTKNVLPFTYAKDKELREEGKKLQKSIDQKLAFPFKVSFIRTQPSIYSILPVMIKDSLCPLIRYVSRINIQDTTLLNKECDDLHGVIKNIYKGIDRNSKCLYQALEDIPTEGEVINNKIMIREFK